MTSRDNIKAHGALMWAHVFMVLASCLAVAACLYAMRKPSLWAAVLFAFNMMLIRLNIGRYLVLMKQRRLMIAARELVEVINKELNNDD